MSRVGRWQTYPNLEILVVDDRSTDRTGEIARRFAAEDSRIRVLTIEHLPAGWTGKTHALHRAAADARGEWLWFLDADTLHAPEALVDPDGVRPASRCGPGQPAPGAALRDVLGAGRAAARRASSLMQSFPLHLVHSERSRLAFANGQYILIRRTAYEAAGGHEAVRDRFVEDIGLAGRVKARGFRIRVALVRGIVTCRMYSSLGQLVRGWSRILYDALDRRADPPGRAGCWMSSCSASRAMWRSWPA